MPARRTSHRIARRTSRNLLNNPRPIPVSRSDAETLLIRLQRKIAGIPETGPRSIYPDGTIVYADHISFTDVLGNPRKIYVQFIAMDPRFPLKMPDDYGFRGGGQANFVDFRDPQNRGLNPKLVALAGDADGAISVGVPTKSVRSKGSRLLELTGANLNLVRSILLHEMTHAYDIQIRHTIEDQAVTWDEMERHGGYQGAKDFKYLNRPYEIRAFTQNILETTVPRIYEIVAFLKKLDISSDGHVTKIIMLALSENREWRRMEQKLTQENLKKLLQLIVGAIQDYGVFDQNQVRGAKSGPSMMTYGSDEEDVP